MDKILIAIVLIFLIAAVVYIFLKYIVPEYTDDFDDEILEVKERYEKAGKIHGIVGDIETSLEKSIKNVENQIKKKTGK